MKERYYEVSQFLMVSLYLFFLRFDESYIFPFLASLMFANFVLAYIEAKEIKSRILVAVTV
jgi:hypothetical protein